MSFKHPFEKKSKIDSSPVLSQEQQAKNIALMNALPIAFNLVNQAIAQMRQAFDIMLKEQADKMKVDPSYKPLYLPELCDEAIMRAMVMGGACMAKQANLNDHQFGMVASHAWQTARAPVEKPMDSSEPSTTQHSPSDATKLQG